MSESYRENVVGKVEYGACPCHAGAKFFLSFFFLFFFCFYCQFGFVVEEFSA